MTTTWAVVSEGVRRIARLVCVAWCVTVCGCAAGSPRGSAPWTIRCLELQGPNRRQHVERIAETLRHTPDIRSNKVFVTEESDGFVRLYYGRYHRPRNPKTGKRLIPANMRADLDLIRELGDDAGRRYFLRAMPARTPMPDVGNPAWALSNLSAMYSLQVAVFEPTDVFWGFKQAAAQYCQVLRERGYEAYYHHTDASSMVTIGSFGPDAVHRGAGGYTYYSPQVLALQRDEVLKYNIINGGILRVRNADGVMVPVSSALVEIPHPSDLDQR